MSRAQIRLEHHRSHPVHKVLQEPDHVLTGALLQEKVAYDDEVHEHCDLIVKGFDPHELRQTELVSQTHELFPDHCKQVWSLGDSCQCQRPEEIEASVDVIDLVVRGVERELLKAYSVGLESLDD